MITHGEAGTVEVQEIESLDERPKGLWHLDLKGDFNALARFIQIDRNGSGCKKYRVLWHEQSGTWLIWRLEPIMQPAPKRSQSSLP